MRIVEIAGIEWVIEMNWSRGDSRRRLVADAKLSGAVSALTLKLGRKSYLLGSTPSKKAVGRYSLAAFLALRTMRERAIYVVSIDGGYWITAVVDGVLLPGSDAIVPTLEDAKKTLAYYRAGMDFKVYAPAAVDPGAQEIALSSWVSSKAGKAALKASQVRALSEARGVNYTLVTLMVAALAGAGYVLWNQRHETPIHGTKRVDAAMVRQRLDRMADQKLLEAMRRPPGGRLYREGVAALYRLGYARYGWRMKTATFLDGSVSSLWDRTLAGNIEEMRQGVMKVFGGRDDIGVEVTPDTQNLDSATVTISYESADRSRWSPPKLSLHALRALLPKEREAVAHIVSEVQKVPQATFRVLETHPFIRPSQVPKKVTYHNPYIEQKISITGSKRHRLVQMVDALDDIPYFRTEAIDVQFSDEGQIKQWVIRGQVYEKN